MQLRLKSQGDVRLFALSITLVALTGNYALSHLILPPALAQTMLLPGAIITIILAAPISFFVGSKILDVHQLTLKLEHTADHDPLTGASTRLSLYKQVAGCDAMELAVIVADIDHFKRINDRYGHQAGDAALQFFTSTLMRHIREDDIIARFGGEEFIILLKRTKLRDAKKAANRLAQTVREKPLFFQGQHVQMTASFGVAAMECVDQVDRAIHHADLAVYRAKTTGRDKVCVYDPRLDVEPASAQEETRLTAMPGP